ncbi:MAG: hypothetical protein S4CHLAM37_07060 [Chlamydiia bacterium]|nr:hypothetical protein [Chlamydiia bacterium]
MNRFLFSISLVSASFFLQADESDRAKCEPPKEEAVDTRVIRLNFLDEVDFNVPGCVIIKQGTVNEYRIVGDKASLREIKVSATSGDLTVQPKGLQIGPRKIGPITLYVTAKNLQQLKLKGNANCDLKGISTQKLIIETHGNATVKGDLILQELVTNIHGNAKFTLKGTAQKQSIAMHGNSTFDASKLSSNSVDIDLYGNGKAMLKVSQKLTVSISGNGSVSYIGNPKTLKHTIRGKGSLRRVSR